MTNTNRIKATRAFFIEDAVANAGNLTERVYSEDGDLRTLAEAITCLRHWADQQKVSWKEAIALSVKLYKYDRR